MQRNLSRYLIVFIAIIKNSQCLLCNGDLEAYVIPSGFGAAGINSNYSCWY